MKRLTVLLLAVCLAVGLCAPAGALSFTDAEQLRHHDAVTMMVSLGLISGYEDGRFLPRNNIRRSEAAKVVALIRQAAPKAAKTAGFSDVPENHWAAPYISFCAEKGIIAGSGGAFRPNDYVTVREFAKMLLVCLGYDDARYACAVWASNVDADAKRLGFYEGLADDYGCMISRDDACLLMYNAMQCYAVTGTDKNGQPRYVLDELMNPITYMEYRFRVVKYSGVLEANEFADLTAAGTRLGKGLSRLAGHSPLEVTTPYAFLGHEVTFYTMLTTTDTAVHHTVIGSPYPTDMTQSATVTSEEHYLILLRSGFSVTDSTEFFFNGSPSSLEFSARLGADYEITVVDRSGDGKLEAVIVTNFCQGTVIQAEPLTVSSGSTQLPVGFLKDARELQVGDTVRCAEIGGRFLVD